jgi:hypothetical protein
MMARKQYALTRYLVVFQQFKNSKCTVSIGKPYTHHFQSYRRARTESRTMKFGATSDGGLYYTRGIHIERVRVLFFRDEEIP